MSDSKRTQHKEEEGNKYISKKGRKEFNPTLWIMP